ncbi:hypothetical protein SAMD00019534_029920 [Acytostelium subglobosum LB1]|uniref:hypothetical protein n=1 Tax=Acytostelium subglobosum LB1 TaxID=1410327 RepID=UPI000644C955|nr:hypothetical protein SAMD00019534_029920 [Acytostelium subglobosum LB1]GAM19817.1 hypothetical protein SAMD00019534_029920 [Acytostelium subglobosum LB1]|eukprot:XP_012756579.1 hypothetical protein SAMD00019534_029920 [Acytostelium subglobosum LB1]
MSRLSLHQQFCALDNSFKQLPIDLLTSLIRFLSHESTDLTYDLHLMLYNYMLTLFSTEMYRPITTTTMMLRDDDDDDDDDKQRIESNVFLTLLMRMYTDKLIPENDIYIFIKQLYVNITTDKPRPNASNGLLNSIGNAASYLLLIPWSAYRYFFPPGDGTSRSGPLSDLSLLTLLAITQYHNPPNGNPFRRLTNSIQDTLFVDLDTSGSSSPNNNRFIIAISMSTLYERIIISPSSDKNLLLLYYLLLDNPNFFRYVQSRTDIDSLVLPLLQVLYSSFEEKPQQVYMILIIILILSQDTLFNANVHSLVIHQVLWYKERLLKDISLGGLLMVVLIKSILFNLSKLRDVNLHMNCLAILANLSSNIAQIHPYPATRLVKLLEVLTHRFIKLKKVLSSSPQMYSAAGDNGDNHNNNNSQLEISITDINSGELQTHFDFLHTILQIVNNTLTYRATSNLHLIYSLLHHSEYLSDLVATNDEMLSDISTNILNILSFFTNELAAEKTTEDWSTERILSFLETKSKQMLIPPSNPEGILRFQYEEVSDSYEFITPYMWTIIYNFMGRKWDANNITLFQIHHTSSLSDPLPLETSEGVIGTTKNITESAINI